MRMMRFDVVGKVNLHRHWSSESGQECPVNRQPAGQSGIAHHVLGAGPDYLGSGLID